MRRTLGSRLPVPRLSRCLSSTIIDTLSRPTPKQESEAPKYPQSEPKPKLKHKHKPKPKAHAAVDPSDQLARRLRNDGSIDTTIRQTLVAQQKWTPGHRRNPLLEAAEPSDQLARKHRNLDSLLFRTPSTTLEANEPASVHYVEKQSDRLIIDLRPIDPAQRLNQTDNVFVSFEEIVRREQTRRPSSHTAQTEVETSKPASVLHEDEQNELAQALRNKGPIEENLLHKLKSRIESSERPQDDAETPGGSERLASASESASAPLTRSAKKRQKKKKAQEKQEAKPQGTDSAYRLLDNLHKTATSSQPGWGPDTLQPTDKPIGTTETPTESNSASKEETTSETPKDIPNSKSRFVRTGLAPHLKPDPSLSYIRRIEGLLEPTDGPTLEGVVPPSEQYPIARLSHGLDRVLFNPGIHWLQDPRSKVYNFPPYLEAIPKVTDFAFERLGSFIKSSRDNDLWELARREKRTFAGSTSSLSGMLSHVYFLLSGDKEVNTDNLSRHFGKEPRDFTSGQRMPASVVLNYNDGVYAIDSDSDKERFADKNILTWMGTLLEKFLTSTPEEFAPYMRFNPPPPQVEKRLRDAYRYAKSKKFVMRSQLDCVDPRLPGTGVFDIKTRACLPIRMDLLNFEENSGYILRSQTGKMESFEREYYDLIRSAFLKYSFQVRIGNMDGVIVAYHNTAQIFGFQYISLQEMDEAVFGSGEGVGDRVFDKCVGLLEKVLEEAAACFPGESVKCTFEKLNTDSVMNVWVQQEKPEVAEGETVPITQLEVKASNFLGQMPVRGSTAVASIDEPWTTHWVISRLMTTGDDVHQALDAAKARQFRHIDIPTGLDMETVGAMWSALNFGGVERTEAVAPPVHYFKEAGPRTQELRDLARAGRAHTAKKELEEAGQAKVWVNGTVEWTELQRVLDLFRIKETE